MANSNRDDLGAVCGGLTPPTVAELTSYLGRGTAAASGGEVAVEHVETHLSHVFLCPHTVYKLLKPVKFAFVDFSSVARRRDECRAEVELNRPLAGDVYLAAEPICRLPSGEIRIGEAAAGDEVGAVVDWAVKMRRLRADQTLESLVARGAATDEHVQSLATLLSSYYASAPRAMLNRDEYRAAVEQHVRDNLAELSRGDHGLSHCLVERVHATQLIVLGLCRAWFDRRVDEGRVIAGHGDLRPEHVYFTPEPVVIDCLAFSRELRTLDVADEVAFLAMELRRLGSVTLAEGLVAAYGQQAADDPPRGLWAFYQAYRACVRAKVAVLRAAQLDEPLRGVERSAARAYLELADSVAKPLARPMCIVVRGLSGTGKSTLAAALSHKLGIVHLQSDRIRKQLFPDAAPTNYGQGCYTTAARTMVYDAMRAQACERLSQRQSVILDGTFLSTMSRAAVAEVATRRNAGTLFLSCHCSAKVAAQRLAKRAAEGRSESDARMETLRRQADEEESDPTGMHAVRIDTTEPIERQVEVACEALGGAFNLAIGESCGGSLRLH